MITCSPPRFALPPSRGIDASSHLFFRAAGIQPSLLAVLGVALLHAGEPKVGATWQAAPTSAPTPQLDHPPVLGVHRVAPAAVGPAAAGTRSSR
jgi:hypothetical protein